MKSFVLTLLLAATGSTLGWSQAVLPDTDKAVLPDTDKAESGPGPADATQPAPASTEQEDARKEDARDPILYSEDSERIGPLTNKLMRNILLDQKDIWTSPFHIQKSDIVPLIILGAGTGVLLSRDRVIATQLPNTVDQVTIAKDVSNIGAEYTILPVTIGLYAGGAIFHNAKARETGILGGEAALDALVVVSILKEVTQRPRPLAENGQGDFFKGGDSFPSGHSIETWALASVVAHEYNKNIIYPIAAYGLASLVSFSRLAGQQHFSSDILVGSAMGYYIGRHVFTTHEDHEIHRRSQKISWLHPQLMPEFDPQTGTRGVALSWAIAQ